MPRICITHEVEDVQRWLRGKAERVAAFAAFPGDGTVTDLVALDGSNHAAVIADVDDLDGVKEFLASMPPEVLAQAESHGVKTATMVVYVEA